jgi:hypothetical protein
MLGAADRSGCFNVGEFLQYARVLRTPVNHVCTIVQELLEAVTRCLMKARQFALVGGGCRASATARAFSYLQARSLML